jgi:hypothetical protein
VTKNENPAIEIFWYLLKAEEYKDNWGAQNLKQLEKKRAFVKKYDPDPMVFLFEGTRNRNN